MPSWSTFPSVAKTDARFLLIETVLYAQPVSMDSNFSLRILLIAEERARLLFLRKW